jgi:hypothetical protein
MVAERHVVCGFVGLCLSSRHGIQCYIAEMTMAGYIREWRIRQQDEVGDLVMSDGILRNGK